ncbi:(3S,6E)-nerolidol synthase 1-like [Curcuma longa]|uniref:(3S,6E)-nerolidol synthase 1-like n=1 Tax=Curcuma longa TaxID=136217 RepID=UPI003D9E96B9
MHSCMVLTQCSFGLHPKFVASLRNNSTNPSSNTSPPLPDFQKQQKIMKPYRYHDQESLCSRHTDKVEEVRRIVHETKGEKETLLLIDSLQKLSVDYHFEEEIEEKMHSLYEKRLKIINGEANNIMEVSLLFRLLRQAQYPISTDVFDRFLDRRGEFMASLTKEIEGLISLFEASNLNFGGELILYRANEFSRIHLKPYMTSLDADLAVHIKQILDNPYHLTLERFKARQILDNNTSKFYYNFNIVELGKMDFSMIQSLHQKELKEVSRWWKESGLGQELGFARVQPLKWFTWPMTCLPNPKFSKYRIVLSKVIAFVYLLDDIFDVKGSLDELYLFTQAIERWDHSSMNSLPDYMRACFKVLEDTINEIARIVFEEHGWNSIEYLKKSWIQLSKAFLVEAKWLIEDEVPTVDDYMKTSTVSCGVPLILVHLYFLLGHGVSENLVENLRNLISCPARILRLWDDLGSAKDEEQNGRDGSLLACLMKENPHCSSQVARGKVMQMIDEAWEELNKESFSLSTSMFSRDFVIVCLNAARMVRVIYNYDEEHKLPMLKEYINLLLFEQI